MSRQSETRTWSDSPLMTLLKEQIRREGPIPVEEYMTLSLAHPEYGYYTTRMPFGAQGDFTTAPEIGQVYGELIGAWVAHRWQCMQCPRAVLLELGPGRGTLMRDLLRVTCSVPGFHDAIDIVLLEISPVLEAVQRQALDGLHPRLLWIRRLEDLPALPLLFVASEFFDALPVRQMVATLDGSVERRVALDNSGALAFHPQAGDIAEYGDAARAVMSHLAAHIVRHGGSGLAIDYGYISGSQGDTLQALRRHTPVHPLEAPGEADLTAHVDFDILRSAAEAQGAVVCGPVAQGAWLKRLGAELRTAALCRHAAPAQRDLLLSGLERLVSPAQMGELFRVLAISHPALPPLEGF